MLKKSTKIGLITSAALISVPTLAATIEKLQLNLSEEITVSGVSSGGYMASQFHIAHSSSVKGAGIIAAGPYNCAEGSLMTAMKQCLADGSALAAVNLSDSVNQASDNKTIDAPTNLKSDRVWLLHGTLDKRVGETVTDGLYQQYRVFVGDSNIRYLNDKAFNHVLPTKDFGIDCKVTTSPFIANCNYDAAGEMLSWLHPDAASSGTSGGILHQISQPQTVDNKSTGLAENGYLYVPKQCTADNNCQIHITFHGCQQNEAAIGKDYIENGGFNAAADRLNLVVLYPQIASGNPLNPMACWDWWGYTAHNYHTQNGPQIKAIKQMIKQLSQSDINNPGVTQ